MIWLLQATAHLAAGIARVGPARLESKSSDLGSLRFCWVWFHQSHQDEREAS